jgi:hypothetical protein
MKIKKYGFALAVAILTFALGVSVYTGVRIAVSLLSSLVWKEEVVLEPIVETVQAEPLEVVTASPPIVIGLENDSKSFENKGTPYDQLDFTGEYYIDQKPRGFEDFDYIAIFMSDYEKQTDDGTYGVPIPPKGSVQTIKPFKFKRIAIGGPEITFQTEEVDGISYKFTGRFSTKAYCEIEGDQPDLEGQLIKFMNGTWAASTNAKLYVPTCGC